MTKFYWQLIGGAVLAVVVGIFIASWLARGREIDRLESWQVTVIQSATDATVLPDKNGKRKLLAAETVPAAIAGLKRSVDSCAGTLAGIDQAALKDKAMQATLDSQLSAILDGQSAAAESTRARITDLLGRKATGDRVKDCEVMESDSAAAWNGWKGN